MYRDAEKRISDWLENGKAALLIYGARQVGKTWLIRSTLTNHSITYMEVNLLERTDILERLQTLSNATEIVTSLELYSDIPLTPGKSIIFLDEIQAYPEILTKIKFLAQDGRYRFILSGSNLGVELRGLKSMPVGYVEQFQMFPMNLFEFARAMGATPQTLDHVKQCFSARTPVDPVIHGQMLRTFYYYLMTGGMPSVVNTLIEKRSLAAVDAEQKTILNQYKADFIKYEAENRRLKIISVYDEIPSQLNKQNRRFIFTYMDKELKFDRYEESFLWLKDAAVAIPVYNAQQPLAPLEQSRSSNLFKLYQSDTGLLTSCYPAQLRNNIMRMDPELELNFGSLFENYVACQMYTSGLKLLYYKSQKIGEIDFITELNGRVVPIEVKSGKDYKKHKALDNLLAAPEYSIQEGIVLSTSNIEIKDNIFYCPVYMAELIREETPSDVPLTLDIFGTP